jgi:hypothetical protein
MSFQFQFGEFINETISFDWISWLLAVVGLIIALFLYYKQRFDSQNDAYDVFVQGLPSLYKAADDTVNELNKFKESLETNNDLLINPSLSSSFNAHLIDRIDLTHLSRAYKAKHRLLEFRKFLVDTDFIKGYHEYFIGEVNYFRDNFLAKESIYKKWQLLPSYIFFEVKSSDLSGFKYEYEIWCNNLYMDSETVGPEGIINRTRLVEIHIKKLAEISFRHIEGGKNLHANKVNKMCNEVILARDDMDAIKNGMIGIVKRHLEAIKKIESNLVALHQPLKTMSSPIQQ